MLDEIYQLLTIEGVLGEITGTVERKVTWDAKRALTVDIWAYGCALIEDCVWIVHGGEYVDAFARIQVSLLAIHRALITLSASCVEYSYSCRVCPLRYSDHSIADPYVFVDYEQTQQRS